MLVFLKISLIILNDELFELKFILESVINIFYKKNNKKISKYILNWFYNLFTLKQHALNFLKSVKNSNFLNS